MTAVYPSKKRFVRNTPAGQNPSALNTACTPIGSIVKTSRRKRAVEGEAREPGEMQKKPDEPVDGTEPVERFRAEPRRLPKSASEVGQLGEPRVAVEPPVHVALPRRSRVKDAVLSAPEVVRARPDVPPDQEVLSAERGHDSESEGEQPREPRAIAEEGVSAEHQKHAGQREHEILREQNADVGDEQREKQIPPRARARVPKGEKEQNQVEETSSRSRA